MVNRHTSIKIRKTHRYLGLFLGIQFLLWYTSSPSMKKLLKNKKK